MSKRKICVVITARPSYSRVKTVLQAIREHPALELQLVVSGSALLDRYGTAINYIEKDGFTVNSKVFNVLEGENLMSAAKTTGIGILELSTVFNNLQPDIIVTVADRFETMATAVAATYMNIPLAHIQGGEVTGNIDEKVRHSITKLADYHFVSSEGAKDRVVKMGEEAQFVFNTGCPSIDLADQVLKNPMLDFHPVEKYGGVGAPKEKFRNGYLVVMQHPVTNEYKDARRQVEETLFAIKETSIPTLWFWPNVDAGSDGTSKGIRSFREREYNVPIHFLKNMEPIDFLKVLKNSLCLVGNSSVGIRECAWMGVPVVNIGTRQNRRDQGINVVNVGYSRKEISDAITHQIAKGHYESDAIYGGGSAGILIADHLAKLPLRFHKTITY
jgi:UDP-hydrolysing UDP-N-acetyl-D-glucosamine 2-epimerase